MTIFPTIHLNGTAKADLLEGYLDALTALRDAHDALCKTAPNGRDYYVADTSGIAINIAMDEHRARLRKLDDIKKEIEAIAMAVSDA